MLPVRSTRPRTPLTILDVMAEAIDEPDEMSPYAPRITTIKIPVKIGELRSAPAGDDQRYHRRRFGANISIEDDGTVFVGAADGESAQAAIVSQSTPSPTRSCRAVGERSSAPWSRPPFGAFVSLPPGRDGLAHLQARQRINKVEDVVNVGSNCVEIADIDESAARSARPVDDDKPAEHGRRGEGRRPPIRSDDGAARHPHRDGGRLAVGMIRSCSGWSLPGRVTCCRVPWVSRVADLLHSHGHLGEPGTRFGVHPCVHPVHPCASSPSMRSLNRPSCSSWVSRKAFRDHRLCAECGVHPADILVGSRGQYPRCRHITACSCSFWVLSPSTSRSTLRNRASSSSGSATVPPHWFFVSVQRNGS